MHANPPSPQTPQTPDRLTLTGVAWAYRLRSRLFGQAPSDVAASRWPATAYFLLTLGLYLLLLRLRQPRWMLGGEMWAEMGSNYFVHARSTSLWNQLFALDAGYIPLPQRILSLIIRKSSAPVPYVPYLYTWIAAVSSGLLVGSFCLSAFRRLIASDTLRFVTCLCLLMASDFESRTFVNFTYFGAYHIAFLTALAFRTPSSPTHDRSIDIPVWGWFTPLLMMSKPAILTLLPALLWASLTSTRRFRRITWASCAFAVAQSVQLGISAHRGVMAKAMVQAEPLSSRCVATLGHFFGLLARYLVGPQLSQPSFTALCLVGVVLFLTLVILLLRRPAGENALIIMGLWLLFGNTLLNCFVLNISWNRSFRMATTIMIHRHTLIGFSGFVLILTALCSRFSPQRPPTRSLFPTASLIAWFLGSKFFALAYELHQEPQADLVDNSQWQAWSHVIGQSGLPDLPVCVPINPHGWLYAQGGCNFLPPTVTYEPPHTHRVPLGTGAQGESLLLAVPAQVQQRHLVSFTVWAQPLDGQPTVLRAQALLQQADGSVQTLHSQRHLPGTGGLMLWMTQPGHAPANVQSIRIRVETPVQVGMTGDGDRPSVLWMGY